MNIEAVRYITLRTLGNFLLLFALYGVGAIFGPAFYYQVRYEVIQFRGIHYTVEDLSFPVKQAKNEALDSSEQNLSQKQNSVFSFANVLAGNTDQILVPVDTEFSIVIPKIGASARIYPNVDPNDPSIYLPILQKGIAQAKGSVFPGMNGSVYLFAHSTDNWWDVGRYNAVFYLLKDLTPGDEIIVFFQNRRYDYTVEKSVITDPTDVSFLTHGQEGNQELVLQTCWPPGTSWQRLYVIALPNG